LRLNNLLNEHFDKSQESSVDSKILKDQHDRKEKELALKSKELQDVTVLLSKKDKEI
jgi:hypothetical protein